MAGRPSYLGQFLSEYINVEDMVGPKNTKFTNKDWKYFILRNNRNSTIERPVYDVNDSRHIKKCEIKELSALDFCTGSKYLGEWNQFGMCGEGEYTFPNGVRYQGSLCEGMFHGKGKIIYPNGAEIHAIWCDGIAHHKKLVYSDGLQYKPHNWKYCQYPDRRYSKCRLSTIPPIGQSNIAPDKPERKIPEGCYDTIDGIFNPKLNVVYNPNTKAILRIPTKTESDWIIKNCRRGSFNEIPSHRKPVPMEPRYDFDRLKFPRPSTGNASPTSSTSVTIQE